MLNVEFLSVFPAWSFAFLGCCWPPAPPSAARPRPHQHQPRHPLTRPAARLPPQRVFKKPPWHGKQKEDLTMEPNCNYYNSWSELDWGEVVIIGLGHISRFQKTACRARAAPASAQTTFSFSQAGISELPSSPGLDKLRYASPVDLRPF